MSRLAVELEAVGARAIAALPPRVARTLSRDRRVLDGQILDPGVALLLRVLALRGADTFVSSPDADPVRERARVSADASATRRWPTPVAEVRELTVDGGNGPLPARLYRARAPGPAPLVVFFHGGGWVLCDLDTHDEPCRMLCRHAGVHVLSVAYRLAPEDPFPAAVTDALASTRWAIEHAAELGARADRVAVGGDSAGGNLAAVVAQEMRDAGLALQLLIYPGLDLVATDTRSGQLFGDGFYLDGVARDWCKAHYLGGADPTDPRLSPIRADDLSGLAPAIVATAAFDPLRDEGEAYAQALAAAGNRAVSYRAAGLIHGFMNLTGVNRASREAMLVVAGMVRAELHAP